VLHVQDEERRRIARELHDDLGQQLSLLRMVLSQNKNEEADQIANSALASVRNLSYLLHPPLLDETGLRAALDWFIDGVTKRSGIQIVLTIRPQDFPRLSGEIETAIFRVIQEALTNVVRHAKTESARVELDKQADLVVVRVRDYGQGLPAEVAGLQLTNRLGVGITGMRERIRQFGGELMVTRSEPGTLVEAQIPLFG
jgi:signal transduction histidine kinase